MSGHKNGLGRRAKSMIDDWLVFNTTELAWIGLAIGGVLLVGYLM